jgi:ATP-dependent RNA helicase DeaD
MSEIFASDTTFADLGLRNSVLRGVEECGFLHPTTIQAALIPAILNGKDVFGQAKTGTGKTAAFGLPILHGADPDVGSQALVLAPTRELAVQICNELEELGKHTPIRCVPVVGGERMTGQIKALKGGAQIVVGTPGRIMDMHGRGLLKFDNIRWAMLDEVDRMLDIGFRDDIRKILSQIKGEHQTVFVSATISDEIERLARKFMREERWRRSSPSPAA